jgi:hypothetical protein
VALEGRDLLRLSIQALTPWPRFFSKPQAAALPSVVVVGQEVAAQMPLLTVVVLLAVPQLRQEVLQGSPTTERLLY